MCVGEVQRVAFSGDIVIGERHEEEAAKRCSEEGAVNGLEAAVRWGVDV